MLTCGPFCPPDNRGPWFECGSVCLFELWGDVGEACSFRERLTDLSFFPSFFSIDSRTRALERRTFSEPGAYANCRVPLSLFQTRVQCAYVTRFLVRRRVH